MLFFSLESSAKDCSAGTLSILKRDKTQISSCHLLKGLQGDKKVEHVLIVRTELIGKAARGVGIEIYKKDSLNSLVDNLSMKVRKYKSVPDVVSKGIVTIETPEELIPRNKVEEYRKIFRGNSNNKN